MVFDRFPTNWDIVSDMVTLCGLPCANLGDSGSLDETPGTEKILQLASRNLKLHSKCISTMTMYLYIHVVYIYIYMVCIYIYMDIYIYVVYIYIYMLYIYIYIIIIWYMWQIAGDAMHKFHNTTNFVVDTSEIMCGATNLKPSLFSIVMSWKIFNYSIHILLNPRESHGNLKNKIIKSPMTDPYLCHIWCHIYHQQKTRSCGRINLP